MQHPFAELISLQFEEQKTGYSRLTLTVEERHLNPHGVVHGAVLFALADTGMGFALYPVLAGDQSCATIDIKINYFKPVFDGQTVCITELVNCGKRIANLESKIFVDDTLVANANGNYAIFPLNRSR